MGFFYFIFYSLILLSLFIAYFILLCIPNVILLRLPTPLLLLLLLLTTAAPTTYVRSVVPTPPLHSSAPPGGIEANSPLSLPPLLSSSLCSAVVHAFQGHFETGRVQKPLRLSLSCEVAPQQQGRESIQKELRQNKV